MLLGVIDDGCPLAAAQFRKISAGAAAGTRVRAIWDQNQTRGTSDPHGTPNGTQTLFGQTLPDFQYGAEFWRNTLTTSSTPQMGLNDGSGCTRRNTAAPTKTDAMRKPRIQHAEAAGSHTARTSWMCSPDDLPPSSRVGSHLYYPAIRQASRPATTSRATPTWYSCNSPTEGFADATGVWLKAYVIDAIGYILTFADPNKTDNVVINLSYGPTTGPHDGTHELEQALIALVTEYDGMNKKPKLDIVLASGNSYLSESHVEFTGVQSQPSTVEWTWRVPADNPVLCFAEVWMEATQAANVKVKLHSPSGVAYGLPTSTSVARLTHRFPGARRRCGGWMSDRPSPGKKAHLPSSIRTRWPSMATGRSRYRNSQGHDDACLCGAHRSDLGREPAPGVRILSTRNGSAGMEPLRVARASTGSSTRTVP